MITVLTDEQLENKIIHETTVDFGSARPVNSVVHLTQYDNTLPVIAVHLYKNGKVYSLPSTNVTVMYRWCKPDSKVVYGQVLGCNSDKTIVYFEVTRNMSSVFGDVSPVLELTINSQIACSSNIHITIHRNPIQDGSIPSESEAEFAQVAFTGDYNDLNNAPVQGTALYRAKVMSCDVIMCSSQTTYNNYKDFMKNFITGSIESGIIGNGGGQVMINVDPFGQLNFKTIGGDSSITVQFPLTLTNIEPI